MSCNKVNITSEVFAVCIGHALTTEKEEVMGLLLGDCVEVFKILLYFIIRQIF